MVTEGCGSFTSNSVLVETGESNGLGWSQSARFIGSFTTH